MSTSSKVKSLGRPVDLNGRSYSGKGSAVPLELLRELRPARPLPITIDGTSNRDFHLSASKTNPVALWFGSDFAYLREEVEYNWGTGENNILAADGSASTISGGAVTTTVWYMYLGWDATNETWILRPSATKPSFAEGPRHFETGGWSHPGTSKTQEWVYVGWMRCTANTPTFLAAEKIGYTYHFADTSNPTTATSWTITSTFSTKLPSHDGVKVRGWLETGAAGTVQVGPSSTSGRGAIKIGGNAPTNLVLHAPFETEIGSGGELYALHTAAAGDIHISQVVDVV